jgi:hypothetical protein
MAKLGATILFVSTVVAYITAMKLSGVRLNFSFRRITQRSLNGHATTTL